MESNVSTLLNGPRVVLSLFFIFIFLTPKVLAHDFAKNPPPPQVSIPLPSLRYDSVSYKLNLEHSREHCDSSPCRWWHDYILGLFSLTTDPTLACQLFSQLAEESDFALSPIAAIHSAEACTQDKKKAVKILETLKDSVQEKNYPRWLKTELSLGAIKAARTVKSPDEFSLTFTTLPALNSRKTKVQILQDAVADAAKMKDPSLKELKSELFRLAPRLKRPVTDWWSVGMDALSEHDYNFAIRAFNRVIKSQKYSVPLRRLAYDYLKTSYKAVQNRPAALNVTRKLYGWELSMFKRKKAPADAPHHVLVSGLSLVRFIWTEHHTHEALALLTQIQNILKNRVPLGDLYFIRGRMDEELVKIEGALGWMEKAIDEAPDAGARSQYQWNYAWLNYKLGRLDKARAVFEELAKNETDAGKKAQQDFWLGKALDGLKLKDKARSVWEDIIHDNPLSYYSLLSYRELGRPLPPQKDVGEAPPVASGGTSIGLSGGPLFDWLIAVGELSLAQEMVEDESPMPNTSTNASVESSEKFFPQYARAYDFAPIFSHIFKLSPFEQEKIFSQHPEYIFPKSYAESINEAAARAGLWPEYVFSIMRQESSFDPLAISPANAYGLLQILPSVAKSLAGKEGIKIHDPKDLLDPQTNILLGTRHLRNYWEEFDGQFLLATAAYNASPETVKNWVKVRFRGDPLEFIEDIPYEETRTYVKLVLRNFIDYMRLDSGGTSIAFPEWCLEGIQASNE